MITPANDVTLTDWFVVGRHLRRKDTSRAIAAAVGLPHSRVRRALRRLLVFNKWEAVESPDSPRRSPSLTIHLSLKEFHE